MAILSPLKAQTELGEEKRCRSCGEFWPADGEFFQPMASSRDGLTARCIACIKAGLWQFPPVLASGYRVRPRGASRAETPRDIRQPRARTTG